MVIAIYGLGLIGGSLGRAIKKKTEHTVFGFDTDKSALLKAKLLNAVDGELSDENLSSADIVVLAVAPSAAVNIMNSIAGKLKDGAVVTDCCGCKRKIVAEMEKLRAEYPNLEFVGVHPMAGREFSGISHSLATLFEHAYIILTPVHTSISALSAVKKLYMDIGCEGVEIASAKRHDEMISYTSQLAHIVSSSFVKNAKSAEHAGFSAGSFKDLTRVAKLNPDMWTELFLENRDNLTADIEELEARLSEYKDALKSNDAKRLHELLEEGTKQKEIAENALKERKKYE